MSQYYATKSIAVNLRGERFADESAGNTDSSLNQHLARQPGGLGFLIIDSEIYEDPQSTLGDGVVTKAIIQRTLKAGAPVAEAGSIEDLCNKMAAFGLPKQRLLKEIEHFNSLVDTDRAEELSPARKGNRHSISTPPFFGVGVKAAITFTMGGLLVDESGRVLSRAGSSSPLAAMPPDRAYVQLGEGPVNIGTDYGQAGIPGLFAAGSDVGNVCNFEYMGGLAIALTTGLTAGKSSATFARASRNGGPPGGSAPI